MPTPLRAALRALIAPWVRADLARARLEARPLLADSLDDLAGCAAALAELVDAPTRAASRASFWYSLWDGSLGRCPRLPAQLDTTDYPEEASQIMEEGFLLEAQGADLGLLWPHPGGVAVYHAHPEGFWCVAPDLAAWIRGLAQAAQAGPEVLRAWLQACCEQMGAPSYRVISATGAACALARGCEEAAGSRERLAAYAQAAPRWRFRVSVRAREARAGSTLSVWRSIYDGPGHGLDPALPLEGRFRLLAHPDAWGAGGAVLSVEGGLRPQKLLLRAEALSQVARRGGAVAVASSGRAPEGSLRLEGPLSTAQVKARLQEWARASQAERFTLRVEPRGQPHERQEGLTSRKLTRGACALAQRLRQGARVEVLPEQARAPRQVAAVLWR